MRHSRTTEEFIELAREKYGDLYDYSQVTYINNCTKVCIICKKHGKFFITPNNFLRGHSCKKCSDEKESNDRLLGKEEVAEKINKKYGNGVFDIIEYTGFNRKMKVKSLINDIVFETTLKSLMTGKSRFSKKLKPKHSFDKAVVRGEIFIENASAIHNNKYDYSKVQYENNKTKVCIICPKHGEFWQTPAKHLKGQGCPKCKNSLLEELVENKLIKEKIRYEQHKTFDWLKLDKSQHLDFYLPDYKIAIECQGEQHYSSKTTYGKDFDITRRRDENKYKLLTEHNIKLLYYTKKVFFSGNIHTDITFFSLPELIQQIKASTS